MLLDVAIVGAGPAGCAAAIQCRRLGLDVALFDRTGGGGGLIANAWRIENEPATGGPIDGPEYVRRMRASLARFGLPVNRADVERVDPGRRLVGEGVDCAARAVILATGTAPKAAGLKGESDLAGQRLFYDLTGLRARSLERVVIVGGGEAAFDYALSLAAQGALVDIAVRSSRHRANARLAQAVAEHRRIRVQYERQFLQVQPLPGGCRLLPSDADGAGPLEADVVVVAVGRQPDLPRGLSPASAQLTIAHGLVIAGDARLGALGQAGIAVGDGLQAAQLAADYCATHREND